MKKKFEEWYNKLPEMEKDLPMFKVNGQYVTPRQRLVMEKTKSKINVLHDDGITINELTDQDKEDIVVRRLQKQVNEAKDTGYPIPSFGIFGERPVSLDNIPRHIRDKSKIGQAFLKIQQKRLHKLSSELEE